MSIRAINPATGEFLKEYPTTTTRQVGRAVDAAQLAFVEWKERKYAERAEPLQRAAAILDDRRKEFAGLFTAEMGKPIKQSVAEVEKCAWVCRYYAEHAASILDRETVKTDARESYVRFDPLGIVLAVMPWNFPFWQVFRFAAPAMMAGNACLLKHASNVPGSALKIQEIFREAGFPPDLFQALLIDAAGVKKLISHPLVRAVTLTGSEEAGRSVAAAAGNHLKKVVLELGGSDPFIVFPDCDMEKTVKTAVSARMFNTGQSCIAAKRFILVGAVAEDFASRMEGMLRELKVGDPMDEMTDVGPLAREEFIGDLERQVRQSMRHGAVLRIGGKRIERPGFFFAPTILDRVAKGMPAYEEEVFGPVAAMIRAADEAQALRIANDTPFGLGASLWTKDLGKAHGMATRIDAGMVYVNAMVKSDPRLPFGGVKRSGFGRELSHYGIKEFVNIKTVYID